MFHLISDQQCYLAGWGSGKTKKHTSIYLKNLELKKIPEDRCYKCKEVTYLL